MAIGVKQQLKMGDLVRVLWEDSCHTYGWHDEEEFARPLTIESVGYLHRMDDEYVMLTMTRDENGRWSNSVSIPLSVVRETTKLRKG